MADLDIDKEIFNAVRDGIRAGVSKRFTDSYHSPLEKIVNTAIEKHSAAFRELLEDSIATCIGNKQFRDDISQAVRHSLAKTLIQRFGGEMEKQVNVLKSDPTTRARITLAIEEIVKSKTS